MTQNAPTRRSLLVSCLFLALLLVVCTLLLRQAGHRLGEALYPLKYSKQVEAAATEYDVPPSLIYAVIHTESEFDPSAVSPAEAKGLMQLTDDTYRWALQREKREEEFLPETLFDPEVNIHYGTCVLSLLQEQFSQTETVLAAYNAGQGHVREWLENPAYSADGETLSDIPFPETATYVKRVLATRKQYQILYHLP